MSRPRCSTTNVGALRRLALGAIGTAFLAALGARIAGPSWIAVWIVLVPWLLSLERERSLRRALVSGVLTAVLFALAVVGWFAQAIASYTGASLVIAVVVVMAISPLLEPQLPVVAVLRVWVRRRGAGRPRTALITAGAYVGVEWASGKLFGDTLAHGLFPSPELRQAADLFGASGLTFVIVLANECATAVVQALRAGAARRCRAALVPALGLAVCFGALFLYGSVRRAARAQDDREERVRVAAIQAGITGYTQLARELGTYDATRLILDEHLAASARALERAPDIELLVWPETVYPTTYAKPKSEAGAELDREIEDFVAVSGVPLVLGTYDRDGAQEYNAAAFIAPRDGSGVHVATYRKRRLFPLTERLPELLDRPLVRNLLPWLGTWRAGSGPEVVEVPLARGKSLRIAPLVCYDAVDPELSLSAARRGAELLLVLSNDSWFGQGLGPHQHLVVSAYRSVETSLPQVRATNSGITAVIDATGDIRDSLGLGKQDELVATIVRGARGRTWATAIGSWVGPGALALAVALAASVARRRPSGGSALREE